MATIIQAALENFCAVMFVLAIIVAIVNTAVLRGTPHGRLSEQFFRWFSFFAIGLTGLFTFVTHVFAPERSAELIGWADSPFQYEVGIADLTVGMLGVLAFRRNQGFRLATTVAVVCWLGGDAIGHIRQMVTEGNFTPGNAGVWFWSDVLFPIIMVAAYSVSSRGGSDEANLSR